MRLFRICCEEEITAIKNNAPLKLTFGAPLFQYISYLNGYVNKYHIYDDFWGKASDNGFKRQVRAICKVFADIPRCVPLFEKSLERRREIFKFYSPTFITQSGITSFNVPHQVDDMLEKENEDYTFLTTIKIAGFFEDPKFSRKYEIDDEDSLNERILAIDFPQNVADKFKGRGYYSDDGEYRVEYAIPMYMIMPEHIVADYEVDSETDKKFIQEFDEFKKM